MTAGCLMLTVVGAAVLIGLRPHGHSTISAPDNTLQQVFSVGSVAMSRICRCFSSGWSERLKTLRRSVPHEVPVQFTFMGDFARVERVMKDAPHRGCGKDSRARDKVTIGVRQPMHVAGA